jgi:hypothetical protein
MLFKDKFTHKNHVETQKLSTFEMTTLVPISLRHFVEEKQTALQNRNIKNGKVILVQVVGALKVARV